MAFADPEPVSLDDGDAISDHLPVLDREMLDENFLGDAEFLFELVRVFTRESARTIEAIQDAIGAGDAYALEHGAHRLKGSLGALAALAAADAARDLETIAREGDVADAPRAWARLQRELARLQPELERVTTRQAG